MDRGEMREKIQQAIIRPKPRTGPVYLSDQTDAILDIIDSLRASAAPVVSVKPMSLSGSRTDYFVSIKVGEREVTPHVFREEYKAAYHVALYDWLLNGSGEEPDVVEFGPDDWPARALSPDSRKAEPVAWRDALVKARVYVAGCDIPSGAAYTHQQGLLADIDASLTPATENGTVSHPSAQREAEA